MSCIVCKNSYENEEAPEIYLTEYKGVKVCDCCISDLSDIQNKGNGDVIISEEKLQALTLV